MSKHLLRTALALGVATLALSFTGLVQAQGTAPATNAPAPAPAPAKPKIHQYTGDITSIDAKAGTVIVKKGEDSKTFKIGEKTRYATADKAKGAALTDIKVGDKVTVSYIDEDGVLTARKIAPPKSQQ
jgi:Cu/Ag efflux protein CusF